MFHVSEITIKQRYSSLLTILAESWGSRAEDWFELRKQKALIYAELLRCSFEQDIAKRLNEVME